MEERERGGRGRGGEGEETMRGGGAEGEGEGEGSGGRVQKKCGQLRYYHLSQVKDTCYGVYQATLSVTIHM